MRLGPMKHPVAVELPDGVDADVHIYLNSESAGVWTRISVKGVRQMAGAEGILEEARKMEQAPQLLEIAQDWRLMTGAEVNAYRVNEREEERRASEAMAAEEKA